jgi:predicted ribosomally synthesized peptide with SipW-like signal peptide
MYKKIALSILFIGLVASVVAGATYAYFTSAVAATGNTFTAGKIDIATNTSQTSFLSFSNIYPGDNGTGTLTINNSGDLAANLSVSVNSTDTLGTNKGALSQALLITILNNGNQLYSGTLASLTTSQSLGAIAAGGSETLTVDWSWPDRGTPSDNTSGDNTYQGSSVNAAFAFTAMQQITTT